ncbi:hypothetical protein DER46DRAFT_215175 [Fusarium sp. MPI-SDFR-AT-0072]|nr:hypothetical protein DER46DRAFT_215175 [Fusarium sp. MPI-SDFR-AT-0072]
MLLSVAAPKYVRAETSVRCGCFSTLHFTNPTPPAQNSGGREEIIMIHVNDSIGIWDLYAPAYERIRYLDGAGRPAGD